MRVKITKAVADAIEPGDDVVFVRDSEVPGFALRVTKAGTKSWVVERKVGRKTVRRTVGRFGVMPLPEARAKAMRMLSSLADGDIPDTKPTVVTLSRAVDDYLAERTGTSPGIKKSTADDYRGLYESDLSDWGDLPLAEITRAMVAERHREITKRAPATANRAMRVLSAVMNYAVDNDDYGGAIVASPVAVLKQRRLWNREKRRTAHLDEHSLPAWWALVADVTGDRWPDRCDVLQDYWRFLLLTGMRSSEAARLTVAGVDLKRGLIGVTDMKNRDDLAVPVGPWVRDMLTRRVKESLTTECPWVFPAPRRGDGHTSVGHDVRYIMCAKHDLMWAPHDLRRTYATVLDSLEVSKYVVKRLLSHRVSSDDVTAGYVQITHARLRPVVDRLEARLLELCGAG